MKKILVLCFLLHCFGAAWASDEFRSVRCGGDIPKALIGKHIVDEKVRVTENRHKDIGLQNLGGDEISASVFVSSWMICGQEYLLFYKGGVIRDVLSFPGHDQDFPVFTGICAINDKEMPEMIVAILVKEAGMNTLPAKAAWKIDEKGGKFVSMPVAGLRCPS